MPHPTTHPHALRVQLAQSIKKSTAPSFIPSYHHPAPPAQRCINTTHGATLHHHPYSCWPSHFFLLTCMFFTCFFSLAIPHCSSASCMQFHLLSTQFSHHQPPSLTHTETIAVLAELSPHAHWYVPLTCFCIFLTGPAPLLLTPLHHYCPSYYCWHAQP